MKRHDDILMGVYHKGQEKIWNGQELLSVLVQKHGDVMAIDPKIRRAIVRVFTMILLGEEAAWKISLQLGAMLNNVPARMAATSQAHDEARHFYVMRDYLTLYDCSAKIKLPEAVNDALNMVQSTDSLARKLLGMQLMVEPVALTIFQEVKDAKIEPILTELLSYYERDEARHVALGVHHLPVVMKTLNTISLASLATWQYRLFLLELHGLQSLRCDFETLGLSVHRLFSLAEKKQLSALEEVAVSLGWPSMVWKPLQDVLRYQKKRILGE